LEAFEHFRFGRLEITIMHCFGGSSAFTGKDLIFADLFISPLNSEDNLWLPRAGDIQLAIPSA